MGGVLGGMVIVIALTVIVIAVLRRRRRAPKHEPMCDKAGSPPRLQVNVSYDAVPMKAIKVDSTAVDSPGTILTQPNTA